MLRPGDIFLFGPPQGRFIPKKGQVTFMSRKNVERNISYDDARQRYYVCMDYGKQNGKRMRIYRTFSSLSQARRALRAFEAERVTGQLILPRHTTLSEWLEYWMKEIVVPTRAETTAYCYRKIIDNHLSPALGVIPIQQLRPQHLQQYYNHLLKVTGLSSNTVRRHHALLSSTLHAAVRHDLLLHSPADRVEPPRAKPREAGYYSPANLKALYAAVDGTWLEVIVKLAGYLGLRREEICGLRWNCVDFEQRRLLIREARTAAGASIVCKEPKTPSSLRVLYMPDEIIRVLQREQSRQEANRQRHAWPHAQSDLVVVDDYGLPYSPNGISLAFSRLVARAGLPKLTLHGLRHTFATLASSQGAPLFEIGKALGHSTPSTTGRIYTHLLDQTHAVTIGRVADAME